MKELSDTAKEVFHDLKLHFVFEGFHLNYIPNCDEGKSAARELVEEGYLKRVGGAIRKFTDLIGKTKRTYRLSEDTCSY